jgi:hypothetical protein
MPLAVAGIAKALVDALTLANVLAPFVQRQASGENVTQEEVDAAVDQTLAGLGSDLDGLQALIKQKRGG